MVPDGDRRHAAQSADVIGQILRIVEWDEHIVRELVLRDDLLDSPRRRLGAAPFKHPLERGMVSHGELQIAETSVRETSAIDENWRHFLGSRKVRCVPLSARGAECRDADGPAERDRTADQGAAHAGLAAVGRVAQGEAR